MNRIIAMVTVVLVLASFAVTGLTVSRLAEYDR